MSDLRDRCRVLHQEMALNALLRQGDPVEDLMAFVIAETGRAADPALKDSLPLCLYFGNAQDRDEFVALIREAKPGLVTKKLP